MSDRQKFEKWWKEKYGTNGQRSLIRRDAAYANTIVSWAWTGWQARAELPAPPTDHIDAQVAGPMK